MPLTPAKERLLRSRAVLLPLFDAHENVLVKRYAPGKWSIREVLCHLADAEMVYLWRISRALAEPGSRVEGFDQDVWATRLDYQDRSLEVAKLLFTGCRAQLLYYLESILPEQFEQSVMHSEAGEVTLRQLIDLIVSHTDHHLEQIEHAREGKVWEG